MPNYFEILGVPASFQLDLKLLDERYRALSQQWHPDRFAGASPRDRLTSAEMTATINDAYKVLKDVTARAAYLLKLRGLDLDAEGATAHQMDPAFLMEILELREQLDDARQRADLPTAAAMGREVAQRERLAHGRIATLLADYDQTRAPATLRALGDQVAALRYFKRFQDEVEAIEEQVSA